MLGPVLHCTAQVRAVLGEGEGLYLPLSLPNSCNGVFRVCSSGRCEEKALGSKGKSYTLLPGNEVFSSSGLSEVFLEVIFLHGTGR